MKELALKGIILKQMELLQDACEREMSPEDAARLSAMLAEALALVNSFTPPLPIYREIERNFINPGKTINAVYSGKADREAREDGEAVQRISNP